VNPSGFLNREELETLEAAAKNISAAQLAAQESAS